MGGDDATHRDKLGYLAVANNPESSVTPSDTGEFLTPSPTLLWAALEFLLIVFRAATNSRVAG